MKSGISEMHTHVHINYGKEEENVINKTLSLLSPRHSKWDYSVLRGPRSPLEPGGRHLRRGARRCRGQSKPLALFLRLRQCLG